MCGRAVQTRRGVNLASLFLECNDNDNECASVRNDGKDNCNLSPGNEVTVFELDKETKTIKSTKKVWGLITKGGTKASPLPEGKTKHFQNLMFNARSETIHEKYSFKPLLAQGKCCIIAIDGFYEWKMITKDMNINCTSGKQPYYVHRNDKRPFFIAGLYTSVPSGDEDNDNLLHTFTILTTNASPKLTWLHQRQPLIFWDDEIELLKQWLCNPTKELLHRMVTISTSTKPNYIAWHPVSRKMSNVQYQGDDCIKPIILKNKPTTATIKSFFNKSSSSTSQQQHEHKYSSYSPNTKRRINPYEKQQKINHNNDKVIIIDADTNDSDSTPSKSSIKKIKMELLSSSDGLCKGTTTSNSSIQSFFEKK